MWSDLPLLEALNEFRGQADNDIARMYLEFTGAPHCQVSCNNRPSSRSKRTLKRPIMPSCACTRLVRLPELRRPGRANDFCWDVCRGGEHGFAARGQGRASACMDAVGLGAWPRVSVQDCPANTSSWHLR